MIKLIEKNTTVMPCLKIIKTVKVRHKIRSMNCMLHVLLQHRNIEAYHPSTFLIIV